MLTAAEIKELVKKKGEDDGISHLIYFNDRFNNFVDGLDLVAAYCNKETGGLCFSLLNDNDVVKDYVSWYYFSYKQQEKISEYILAY